MVPRVYCAGAKPWSAAMRYHATRKGPAIESRTAIRTAITMPIKSCVLRIGESHRRETSIGARGRLDRERGHSDLLRSAHLRRASPVRVEELHAAIVDARGHTIAIEF